MSCGNGSSLDNASAFPLLLPALWTTLGGEGGDELGIMGVGLLWGSGYRGVGRGSKYPCPTLALSRLSLLNLPASLEIVK
jgi:hypothetical protein